jgi:hypothetical protein
MNPVSRQRNSRFLSLREETVTSFFLLSFPLSRALPVLLDGLVSENLTSTPHRD